MNKKAFITGISGFAGSFLAEHLLENGYAVSGLVRSIRVQENQSSLPDSVELYEADLLESRQIHEIIQKVKPDVVFHLAALSSPAESFKKPAETITNNITAQINLLEAIRQNNLFQTKNLIISSAEIYGPADISDLPLSESAPMRPVSPYGVSKISQDFLAYQYFLSYKMPVIRVRPTNHIGPRQTPQFVVAAFSQQIAQIEKDEKEPRIEVGNLEAKRDFVDVRDVVRAYTLLIEKGKIGEVYNIGTGKSWQISEILEKLLHLSLKKISVVQDPNRIRPSDIPELRVDYGKLEKDTGWNPQIPIDESLKDTLEYYRQIV